MNSEMNDSKEENIQEEGIESVSDENNASSTQEEGEKKEESGQPEEEKKPKDEQKKKRYQFECVRCGICCSKRDFIPVTLGDLSRWIEKGAITAIFPHLFFVPDQNNQTVLIQIKNGENKTGCPFYDSENKNCTIYYSLPSDCNAYPLAFNNGKWIIKNKECQGLGKGTMTKEMLIRDREAAKLDYQEKIQTAQVLPLINALFTKMVIDQQKKAMENMTPDQKAKLDEILKKKDDS